MPPSTSIRQGLLAQVRRLPETPGVYIMKNSAGEPIYIGKAVNLRSRVRSYFSDSHDTRAQIPAMLQQLADIDWITATTETEALILEADLIRQHKPRYNIDLRDDKHYPYLKVTVKEPFPRLLVVRRIENDGARYFGPYTDASAMRRLAAFAKRIFRLCDCSQPLPATVKKRPCINYAMHRCSGACAGKISQDEYRVQINNLLRFLSGRHNDLLRDLEIRMNYASAHLQFEEAALLRDQIQLIQGERGEPSGAGDCASLQKALSLPKFPATIEAFDISNIGPSFCVAGMVRFKNGMPDKSGYRRYKIKTVAGQNDFAMIMEAVSRRLTRLQNEKNPFPDCILIDGGKGQLHAARKALGAFEDPPAVVALAKREETLFSPCRKDPVLLPPAHPARRLAERIRNEAHRFAIRYHRKVRGQQFSHSRLEELPGIGPKKAKLLLKTFGSLKRIRNAAPEEIAKVKGFNLKSAMVIKKSIFTKDLS